MTNESNHKLTIPIREEILDITKKWVQTGEIEYHKEIITKHENISVPVMHEELVIDKKFIDAASPNQSVHIETIRIPLREDRIEIKKHAFDLEKVDIYKQQIQETELIEEVLQKEALLIKTAGHVDLQMEDGFSCKINKT